VESAVLLTILIARLAPVTLCVATQTVPKPPKRNNIPRRRKIRKKEYY